MNKEAAKQRIHELTAQIEEHNYNYYLLAQSVISDFEFDQLLEELIQLEQQYPEFLSPASPSQRVGGAVTKTFKTVAHKYPMLSLGNTYSEEELRDFDARVRKAIGENFEYVCELKYDGVAIGLTYKNGILVQALTRGDGEKGDDITTNVKTIKRIPIRLRGSNFPEEFEIRGEIYMPRKSFEAINKEREEIGDTLLANPRNAAAGTLKMQDSAVVAARNLDCYLYFVLGENLPYPSHYENLLMAKEWGFKVPEHIEKVKDIDAALTFIHKWNTGRHKLDFDIDGVVLKVNNYEQQKALGFTAKSPRWAISYKYKAAQAATTLEDVLYQVGRTGAITPVAYLKPVLLAGTTVKRASLHNADIIEKLDVRVGDTVFVEKGGEIIPKITGVDLSKRPPTAQPLVYCKHCPECGTPLVRLEGEAQHYCTNELGCPPQIKGKMEHFVSRRAMAIDSLGGETIEQLYEAGLLTNIADIYNLSKEELLRQDRMREKTVNNLLNGIAASKNIPFERVLFAIGIRHIGETTAKKLVYQFKNIDALKKATIEELIEVGDIGGKIAQSIVAYFADTRNIEIIEQLSAKGVKFALSGEQLASITDKLSGLTFVVSGVFTKFSRDEIKKAIEQNGGKCVGSVSGKTNYLLGGENIGPEKIKKAEKLGVKVIGESEFIKMIA